MKKTGFTRLLGIVMVAFVLVAVVGCGTNQEDKDRVVVQNQQAQYAKVQPLPFYDYSIPRDIMIQIYNVVTQESRNTYTVIETMTGQIKFYGPSIGYGIPADVQLTNPLQPAFNLSASSIIEQAEPNGLFSSKNTDGTWVLFVDTNGDITPVYTEQKVTTYPFAVKKDEITGAWVRADQKKASLTVKIKGREAEKK